MWCRARVGKSEGEQDDQLEVQGLGIAKAVRGVPRVAGVIAIEAISRSVYISAGVLLRACELTAGTL